MQLFHDVITYKDKVIATKTAAYDRYISHELRTPLNSAEMGIEYCINKIPENTTDSFLQEIRGSLLEGHGRHAVCEDGLGILNDLLANDKIENGLTKLNKEVVFRNV